MTVQRDAVELGENEDAAQAAVDAITHRDVDNPVFAGERDGRLCALLGEGKKASTRAASHDDGEGFVGDGRPVLEAHRELLGRVCTTGLLQSWGLVTAGV